MFIQPFVEQIRIQQILNELGDWSCGSLSACVVLEYFKIYFDINQIKKDSRDGIATDDYPMDGSNILGVALAIAKHKEVAVKIYSKLTLENYESIVGTFEQPILDDLVKQSNVSFHSPISINALLDLISPTTIPILAFNRHEGEDYQHFSPLIGLKGFSFLCFPVWETDPNDILIDKHEFENKYWEEKLCLLISKINQSPI